MRNFRTRTKGTRAAPPYNMHKSRAAPTVVLEGSRHRSRLESRPAPTVLLSYAFKFFLRENVLQNALLMTDATAIAHASLFCPMDDTSTLCKSKVNRVSQSDGAVQLSRPMQSWLEARRLRNRVAINPARLYVEKHEPSVLAVHLSNFRFCEAAGGPCDGAKGQLKFVFMAGNSIIVRRGLDAWVNSHSLSFCVGFNSTDLGKGMVEPTGSGLGDWRRALADNAWNRGSALYNKTQRAVAADNDVEIATNQWRSRFVEHMRRVENVTKQRASLNASRRVLTGPWAWRPFPLNEMAHEGSFYPLRILRSFAQHALPASPFGSLFEDTWGLSRGRRSNRTSCCQVYIGGCGRGTTPMAGGCELEELLLPTWVWQHHRHLLKEAAPPLCLRLWASIGRLGRRGEGGARQNRSSRFSPHNELVQLVAQIHTRGSHAYMLKAPHHEFNHLKEALGAVLWMAV